MTYKTILRLIRVFGLGLLLIFFGVKMHIDDNAIKNKIQNDLELIKGKIVDIKDAKVDTIEQKQTEKSSAPDETKLNIEVARIPENRLILKLDNNKTYQTDKYNLILLAQGYHNLLVKGNEVSIFVQKQELNLTVPTIAGLSVMGYELLKIEDFSDEYKTTGGFKNFILMIGMFFISLGIILFAVRKT